MVSGLVFGCESREEGKKEIGQFVFKLRIEFDLKKLFDSLYLTDIFDNEYYIANNYTLIIRSFSIY